MHVNVSRETQARLEKFSELVQKWTTRINLISRSSNHDIWTRHILDSLQLVDCVDSDCRDWLDIGSGGGFPALVVAISNIEKKTFDNMTLVESDQRKATFLRTAIRELGLNAKVVAQRIESLPSHEADVISARALADLTKLLEFSYKHLKNDGIALFLKGKEWQKEVISAQASWSFDYQAIPSKTSDESVILKITGVSRV